jgi:hypothetical protein
LYCSKQTPHGISGMKHATGLASFLQLGRGDPQIAKNIILALTFLRNRMNSTSPVLLCLIGLCFAYSCKNEIVTDKLDVHENHFEVQIFDSVRITEKVIYGTNPDVNWMDVYEPFEDNQLSRPVAILAPGGGFDPDLIAHSFELLLPLAEKLAKAGFVAAVINYSTGDYSEGEVYRNIFIQAAHDLKASIRYFRKDAETLDLYRVNPEWVFTCGWSAGAMISLFNAYVQDEAELIDLEFKVTQKAGGIDGDNGNPGYSTHVRALVALSGNMIELSRINSGDPPVLCIHSDPDNVVSFTSQNSHFGQAYGSKYISERASDVGIPNQLIVLENETHTAPIKPACTSCYDRILEFFIAQL